MSWRDRRPWLVVLGALGLLLLAGLALAAPGPAASPPPSGSQPDDWLPTLDYGSVVLKFGLVLLILYATLWALRRWLRHGRFALGTGFAEMQRLHLVESLHLAPRQALHLVRADGRIFLVGASEHSITLVAELVSATETGERETDERRAALSLPRVRPEQSEGTDDRASIHFAGLFSSSLQRLQVALNRGAAEPALQANQADYPSREVPR